MDQEEAGQTRDFLRPHAYQIRLKLVESGDLGAIEILLRGIILFSLEWMSTLSIVIAFSVRRGQTAPPVAESASVRRGQTAPPVTENSIIRRIITIMHYPMTLFPT